MVHWFGMALVVNSELARNPTFSYFSLEFSSGPLHRMIEKELEAPMVIESHTESASGSGISWLGKSVDSTN